MSIIFLGKDDALNELNGTKILYLPTKTRKCLDQISGKIGKTRSGRPIVREFSGQEKAWGVYTLPKDGQNPRLLVPKGTKVEYYDEFAIVEIGNNASIVLVLERYIYVVSNKDGALKSTTYKQSNADAATPTDPASKVFDQLTFSYNQQDGRYTITPKESYVEVQRDEDDNGIPKYFTERPNSADSATDDPSAC